MDRGWYLDVNRFATRTAWAHGLMAFFARPLALVIIAFLLLVALVRARVAGFGGTDLDRIAILLWAALGAALAYAVSLLVCLLYTSGRNGTGVDHVRCYFGNDDREHDDADYYEHDASRRPARGRKAPSSLACSHRRKS